MSTCSVCYVTEQLKWNVITFVRYLFCCLDDAASSIRIIGDRWTGSDVSPYLFVVHKETLCCSVLYGLGKSAEISEKL